MLLGLRQGTVVITLATQRLKEARCRKEYGVLPNVKTVKWEDSTDLETSWCPELRPQSPRSPHDISGQPVLGIIV